MRLGRGQGDEARRKRSPRALTAATACRTRGRSSPCAAAPHAEIGASPGLDQVRGQPGDQRKGAARTRRRPAATPSARPSRDCVVDGPATPRRASPPRWPEISRRRKRQPPQRRRAHAPEPSSGIRQTRDAPHERRQEYRKIAGSSCRQISDARLDGTIRHLHPSYTSPASAVRGNRPPAIRRRSTSIPVTSAPNPSAAATGGAETVSPAPAAYSHAIVRQRAAQTLRGRRPWRRATSSRSAGPPGSPMPSRSRTSSGEIP